MLTSTDRRAWVCMPCDVSGKLDQVSSQSYMAQVVDLSEWDISLILTRRPALGTYLKFEVLLGPQKFAGSRIARVISTRPGADGRWYTECQFPKPLSARTLAYLESSRNNRLLRGVGRGRLNGGVALQVGDHSSSRDATKS
jgi:hypothetical protein